MCATPAAIATCLTLAASCLIFGGCASSFQLPGDNKTSSRLGGPTNRNDTRFGVTPWSVKALPAIRGKEYDFVMYSVKEDGQYCLTADNRREAPVSVWVDLIREDNVVSDRNFPLEYVISPNTKSCIARISRLHKNRDFSYKLSSSWMPGDFSAHHNPNVGYRLPWQQGESYQVSQAFGGPVTTHTTRSSRYAIDFSMPAGTPILAARAGLVVNLEEHFGVGAPDFAMKDKANFVDILHDDGTIATYSHLAEQSVPVRLGQPVLAGDKLGLAGSTGYSSGPHLHFSVWRPVHGENGYEQLSLPVEFCEGEMIACAPVEYGAFVPSRPTAVSLGKR